MADLGRALGMQVIIASRKAPSTPVSGDMLPPPNADDGRIPFDQVLRQATVVVLSLPRTTETLNLVSTDELAKMHPYAVLINIARGGIVDEAAVVQALKQGQFAGYATDVFAVEPADGATDSPLLSDDTKDLNITLSPHLAWFSQRTMNNLGDMLKETVESWGRGQAINVVV